MIWPEHETDTKEKKLILSSPTDHCLLSISLYSILNCHDCVCNAVYHPQGAVTSLAKHPTHLTIKSHQHPQKSHACIPWLLLETHFYFFLIVCWVILWGYQNFCFCVFPNYSRNLIESTLKNVSVYRIKITIQITCIILVLLISSPRSLLISV